MARFRITTILALSLLALCTIYYFCISSSDPDYGYTDSWVNTDGQMLRADSGGSKVRYISSQSAGQYDVSDESRVNQEYTGSTRTQFELNVLEAERDANEKASPLQVPVGELMGWLRNRKESHRLNHGHGGGRRVRK